MAGFLLIHTFLGRHLQEVLFHLLDLKVKVGFDSGNTLCMHACMHACAHARTHALRYYRKDNCHHIFLKVINNACATQAIISILMNVDHADLNLGENLTNFKEFSKQFDPAVSLYVSLLYNVFN